ncbi:MAG: Omp28-related outer membrane protein [Muribaculaceae bacterium]|nr:Omp28-related outer membrane protein [Muribaculaceae bacterium]
MRRISMLLMFLTAMTGIWAQSPARLGWCGDIDNGYGDAGGAITPWITLTPVQTGVYAGNEITSVRIGLNAKANNVYIYLSDSMEDDEYAIRQKVGTLEAGWHTVTLDTPWHIEPDSQIAVGYKATFTKAGGAGYTKGKIPEACNAYYNTKATWVEINGAFCIEALVEGESMPRNELGISSFADSFVTSGDGTVIMPVTVRNYGVNDVENFTLSCTVDGMLKDEQSFVCAVPAGEETSVELSVPMTGIGVHEIEVEVLTVNGEADAYTANNKATAILTERDPAFVRRVVIEEGTGDWCGWCPRGIVGLEMMKEMYGDRVIAIAVHADDIYTTDDYQPFLSTMTSLPGCKVNRHLDGDPYFNIKRMVAAEIDEPVPVGYTVKATVFDNNEVKVNSDVIVDTELDASSLHFAFTVVEDGLKGNQHNSYSGGSTEMGGWESLPPVIVDYEYKDVARGIYPEYDGAAFIDGTLIPDEKYSFEYTFTLPDCIQNPDNIKIIGQVIDASNGFILNACEVTPLHESGVGAIDTDSDRIVRTEVFDLMGHRLSSQTTEPVIVVITYASGRVKTVKKL